MKIYFIGQKGMPTHGGGVEHYVENLATRLAKQGHDVFAYTRHSYSDKNKTEYKGVKLINLPSVPTKNLDTITHTFLAVIDVLFRKADVIHFHSIGPSSLIWLPKLLKRNTTVIATFQSQCYKHQKWSGFAKWFLHLGEKILCNFADAIIVPSKTLQNYAKKIYNKETTYIPNGVTIDRAHADNLIKEWNLTKGEYFLTVSRLIRHKGIQYLIKAYQQMRTNKKLVIVGDGSFTDDYVAELKKLAGDNKNIIFTGNQIGISLAQLYSNAYAFIQPSESEGLSVALLEAMSYSLPVIVSDIEENKEAVGNAGILFKKKNIQDLKKQMRFLIRDKKQRNLLAKKSKQRVINNYDWDDLTADVVNAYQETLFNKNKKYITRKIIGEYVK